MGVRYTARQATPNDCGNILRLIRELAEFEGEQPDQVVRNTEQDLREDCFGNNAFYHCLVVEAVDDESTDDQTTVMVAYAMYYFAYSSWIGRLIYLEDLYVKPSHRGKGLGKGLVCKVAKIGADKCCKGMQWVVQDTNERARQFYNQLNAVDKTTKEGWLLFGAREEGFFELANSTESASNMHFL